MRLIPQSIRWRIQLWHGLLLSVITLTLLSGFYYYEKRSQLEQLDGQLTMVYYRLLPILSSQGTSSERSRPANGLRPPRPLRGRANVPRPRRRGLGSGDLRPRGPGGDDPRRKSQRFLERLEESATYFARWSDKKDVLHMSANAPKLLTPPDFAFSTTTLDPDNTQNDDHAPSDTTGIRASSITNGLLARLPNANLRIVEEFNEISIFLTREGRRELVQCGKPKNIVLLGTSLNALQSRMQKMAWSLAAIGLSVIALGFIGGFYLAHYAISPIKRISQTAELISRGDRRSRILADETESELGQLTLILNQAFDKMDRLVQQQLRFTADASHELRTPLAIVLCQAEATLKKRRTIKVYQESLEACQRAAERMDELVSSLLELARADSGRLSLERTKHDLADLVRDSILFVTPLSKRRRTKLSADLTPTPANVDNRQILQVLNNLLTNAIQHNPMRGKVTVSCHVKDNEATISIADQGSGIDPKDIPHLFERFFRCDKARTRRKGGYGLGLSICLTIVEAHGGHIDVKSQPGQGTIFEIRLPQSL